MLLSVVIKVLILTGANADLRDYIVENVVKNEDSVIHCVRAINKKYFLQRQNIEIIAQIPRDSIIKSFEGSAVVVRSTSNLQHPNFRQTTTKYAAIFLERPNYKKDVKVLRNLKSFDPQGRYIVSMNNEVDPSNLEEYITNIISYLVSIERWNVVILMNDVSKRGTRVFAYSLYSSGNCTRIPKVIDHGECESALNNLFPVFVNLHKCPVRLMAIHTSPYSIIESKNGKKYTHGIESNVVNLIVEKFNGTPEILEEHSGIDIRKKIRNRTGDLAWGTLLQYTIPGTVYSQTHFHSRVVMVIPESRVISAWMNLILPFEIAVWITIGATIAIPLVITLLAPFIRRAFPVEYLLAGFAGTGVSRSPSKLSQRLYYLAWIIGGYIVMQAYLANLTGILTSPAQKKPMQSFDELEKTQIVVFGTTVMRDQFKESHPRIFRDWKVMDTDDYLRLLLDMRTGKDGKTTYIPDILVRNITYGREINFHVIPEAINTHPLALLMANSSVFLEGSTNVVEHMSAAGLIDFWTKNYVMKTVMVSARHSDDNLILSLPDLKPIFLTLCVGCGISIIVFVVEIINVRYRA